MNEGDGGDVLQAEQVAGQVVGGAEFGGGAGAVVGVEVVNDLERVPAVGGAGGVGGAEALDGAGGGFLDAVGDVAGDRVGDGDEQSLDGGVLGPGGGGQAAESEEERDAAGERPAPRPQHARRSDLCLHGCSPAFYGLKAAVGGCI